MYIFEFDLRLDSNFYALFLFIFITQLVAQDIHSLEMSVAIGWQFQCANTTCLNFANVNASDIRECQLACLAQVQCQATSFQQTISSCQLFSNFSSQNNNLLVDVNTVAMVVLDGTRMSSG